MVEIDKILEQTLDYVWVGYKTEGKKRVRRTKAEMEAAKAQEV